MNFDDYNDPFSVCLATQPSQFYKQWYIHLSHVPRALGICLLAMKCALFLLPLQCLALSYDGHAALSYLLFLS